MIAVHETQMEGERRNTAREKDRVMKLEQELRRRKHDLRAQKEHGGRASRHRVHLERTAETEDRVSKTRLREQVQEQRLASCTPATGCTSTTTAAILTSAGSSSGDNKMLTYGKSKGKSTGKFPSTTFATSTGTSRRT